MLTIERLETRSLFAAGAIDPSFAPVVASAARPRTDPVYHEARDVAIDASGRSVVFGDTSDLVSGRLMMYVARFLNDGTADLGFGEYGVRLLDLATGQKARRIAIDHAGRINLAYDTTQTEGPMVQLSQLDANGNFNRRFGRNGRALPRFGPDSHVADLAVDGQNNLVFVANAANQIAVGKLSASGRSHPEFGPRSTRFIHSTLGATASAIAVAEGNRLVIGATMPSRSTSDFGAIKLTSEGLPDTTFGRKGFVAVDMARGRDQLDDLIVDEYGRIVMSGKRAYVGSDALVTAARLTADGALDPRFFRKGTADGTAWAQNTSDLAHFALQFDGAPVRVVDSGGMYALFMQQHYMDVTYNGRRWGLYSSRPDYNPSDFVNGSAHVDFVSVASRGNRISSISNRGASNPLSMYSDYALVGFTGTRDPSGYPNPDLTRALRYSKFTVGANAVLVDGSLVNAIKYGRNSVFIRHTRNGARDMSFGQDGFAYESHPYTATTVSRLIPQADGSFMVLSDGHHAEPPTDSVGLSFSTITLSGDVTSLGDTGTETNAEVHHIIGGTVVYSLYGEYRYEDMYYLRADGSGGGVRYSGEGGTLPAPPNTLVPIPGSNAFYVEGWPDSDGSPLVRCLPAQTEDEATLDPTFAGGVLTGFDGFIVCAQPDGKLIYVQDGDLRRLNTNGSPDPTFGVNGSAHLPIEVSAYEVDGNGRIIVWTMLRGGVADGDVQIARFTKDGQVDATFGGGDGIVAVDTHINSLGVSNVMIDAQNRLIVTSVKQSRTSVSWSATRLQA